MNKNMDKENTKLNLTELKKGGILKQKQKDYFILRTRIPGGYLKADKLTEVAKIAKKYGRGYVHLSTRQCIEIAWVHIKDIEHLKKELNKVSILTGACGPRLRNIVACPGSSVCRFGFENTEKLAKEFDARFFGRDVPKKFKIGLSGCPNSCAKPQENDIGFIAVGEPECNRDICIKCSLCAKVCEEVCKRGKSQPAILMDKSKKPVYRKEFCFFEGDCIRICPVNAWWVKRTGYSVFLGGRVGRFPSFGYKIAEFVDKDEIFRITEKAINCYNKIARQGQRFGEAIEERGIEEVKREVL